MAKFKNIVDSIFLTEDASKDGLRIFYNIDIHIHNANKELPEQPITNASSVAQEAPQVVQQQKTEEFRNRIKNILKEQDGVPEQPEQNQAPEQINQPLTDRRDFESKTNGVLTVKTNDVSNIQTLEDLLAFLGDKNLNNGKPILDEVSVQLVLAMAGANQTPLTNIIGKDDKVLIEINYGFKKDDSIGFKILKRPNSSSVSIVIEKDQEIISSPFDLREFNNQLVLMRNRLVNKNV